MLFNSYIFLFAFLPAVWMVATRLRDDGRFRATIFFLVIASIGFYAWWDPGLLYVLLVSLAGNYLFARAIGLRREKSPAHAKALLGLGVACNLAMLGWFKYANFVSDNLNDALGTGISLPAIVLPIGISFFTFQLIAFLVDVHTAKVTRLDFWEYLLFVSFFPQLIAGPIAHHSELIPQFKTQRRKRLSGHVSQGLTFLAIGLTKKVILADLAAKFASPLFQKATSGQTLSLLEGWSAALGYTAQLYFDFSAYSDMAIGIGLFFGIRLPINFDSPYKSLSIIDFWRRWHITLSRFLRDYLYIPLGGNRNGRVMRHVNLVLTMLLGGIWHGAGWNFLIWGLLHGAYLTVNHAWRSLPTGFRLPKGVSWGVTFVAVIVGWVFFRTPDPSTAGRVLGAMAGLNGMAVDSGSQFIGLALSCCLLLFAALAPNSQQIMRYVGPDYRNERKSAGEPVHVPFRWRRSVGWAIWTGILLTASLTMFSQVSEFIYFQF